MLNTPTLQPATESNPPTDGAICAAEPATQFTTRSQQEPPMYRQVDPSILPVDGEELLDDIFASIKCYVIAEDATIQAAALWVMHTWLMDVWTVSPIANITAPEMRCGKTLLLQVLEELVYRPLATSNITPAALCRSVNEWYPTLLIDEVDSFLKGNDIARGMLNSGLYRKSAFVTRCGGDNQTPVQFSVWCAKALCGIGPLAATLTDRSIVLRLRRKMPGESTESLRRSDPAQWSGLRSRILRWADDHRGALSMHQPDQIPDLNDRANDCWEPLLSIAQIAGPRWTGYARSAAMTLQQGEPDAPSARVELLRDVRRIFARSANSKMFSSVLLRKLNISGIDMRWSRWNEGRPLSAFQLAKMLREFGISAKAIRVGDSAGKNGYERSSFDDAFARYLPLDPDETPTLQLAA